MIFAKIGAVFVSYTFFVYEITMKKKKTILLCCQVLVLLAIAGVVMALCFGCNHADMPKETDGETTAGEQITDETSAEKDTDSSSQESEENTVADENQEPEESKDPSSESTADSSSNSTEPAPDSPSDPSEPPTEAPVTDPEPLAYDVYHAMSAEEQEEYFNSFASPAEFFAWYNAAKDKFIEENPGIEIGPDGIIP